VNSGAHRAAGNAEARGSEARADSRCLIIGTGMERCPRRSDRERIQKDAKT
jgi:hypothetical protein